MEESTLRIENDSWNNLSPLFRQIENHLLDTKEYTQYGYDLQSLSKALQVKENQLSLAIKSAGFSSFREYLNDLRLRHFRQLVEADSDKSIKELIFHLGLILVLRFTEIFLINMVFLLHSLLIRARINDKSVPFLGVGHFCFY